MAFLFAFTFSILHKFPINLLGFSPSGRFAKNVKGREICFVMEKINCRKQELDLVDRLMSFLESGSNSRQHVGRVTEPATRRQLGLLSRLGIRPLWIASEHELEEMIVHYRTVLESVTGRIL